MSRSPFHSVFAFLAIFSRRRHGSRETGPLPGESRRSARAFRRGVWLGLLLSLLAAILTACPALVTPPAPFRTPNPPAGQGQPAIQLAPAQGYAGVYVQVTGQGWPINGLVLITLVDERGRSGILAAATADEEGRLSSGFLYPVNRRWLIPGEQTVLAYTPDDKHQATALFTVAPPAGTTPPASAPLVPVSVTSTATPSVTATPSPSATPSVTPSATATNTPTSTPTPTVTPTPTFTPPPITDWRGEYWANPNLSGPPALVRNDVELSFVWGNSGPAPSLPADNFSARWSQTLFFDAGEYRFLVEVDDGARLYVDDVLVIDEWRDGAARLLEATLPLERGFHQVRLEYFEHTEWAVLRFWWERVTPPTPTFTPTWTPSPTPTPTGTPTSTPSPTPTHTPTWTPSPTPTPTPTQLNSPIPTPTHTATWTPSPTAVSS